MLSRSPALLSYPELLQWDALMFFFCDGLLDVAAFEECRDDNEAFVNQLAPPLPPLFDLNLTNLHVLINEDVFVFELVEGSKGTKAASVETIPES